MISKWFSQKLIEATNETEYEREYYEYVIGAFVFQIQEFLTIVLLAMCFGTILYSILSAVLFGILRFLIGGYHLKSKFYCWATSTLVILFAGWLGAEVAPFFSFIVVVFVVGLLKLVKIVLTRKEK